MKSQNQAILSIGSNQGDRLENVQACIQLIQLEIGTVFSVSKLYDINTHAESNSIQLNKIIYG